jgi:acetyl esterase/lipase
MQKKFISCQKRMKKALLGSLMKPGPFTRWAMGKISSRPMDLNPESLKKLRKYVASHSTLIPVPDGITISSHKIQSDDATIEIRIYQPIRNNEIPPPIWIFFHGGGLALVFPCCLYPTSNLLGIRRKL